MDYDYSDLVEKSRRWIDQATATGWIPAENARTLAHLEEETPRALFDPGQSRPLIVAFMGGTGVGKSSLLNRLAGTAIARTGVERPTSREVTLYHHQSVEIRHLPENLPIASIKIAQHKDETKKNIIWIDMPDFDSIEQSNKHLVLQWLPHIDVLIYVVSPERYKDAQAWRLLLAEGGRHAWLFVLNQWDLGRLEQYEDFKRQLGQAGFAKPIIFRTVCGEVPEKDEFDALASTIASLANEHVVEQLEHRGFQVRKAELRRTLERYRDLLGTKILLTRSEAAWQEQWQKTSRLLQEGFSWPLQQLANHYAEHAADLIANPVTGKYPAKPTDGVWDDWAQARFDDALDEFVGVADQLGIPAAPIKQQLAEVRQKAPKIVRTQTELAARKALANPGNTLQRALLKCVRVAEIVLPLAAIAWVSYKVFTVYYYSNRIDADYLGVDFAIHSSLLIGISWLAPWFILKKVRPSLRTSALKGLNKGLATGLGMIDSEIAVALERIRHDHDRHHQQVSQLIDRCGAVTVGSSSRIDSKSPLQRMLIDKS